MGCVLLPTQEDDTSQPIGYWWRKLIYSKQKLTTTQKNLAIIYAAWLLQPYLGASCIIILAEHEALKQLLPSVDDFRKPERWWFYLLKFDVKEVHRADIKH